MIKLLKYNWRLSSTGFYITIVAMGLLYTLLLIGKFRWGWVDEIVFAFGAMVIAFGTLILIGIACMNFNHGMKSYHRRLIPLSPLSEIGSMTLLAVIYALASSGLSFLYFVVLAINFSYDELNIMMDVLFSPKSIVSILLLVIWSTIMVMSLLMLAIAASYCFKGKHRAWIGVLVFIVVAVLIDYVSSLIVGPNSGQYFSFIEFNISNDGSLSNQPTFSYSTFNFWSLPFLIDVLVLVLQVAAAHYLIKRRVQL